MRNELHIRLKWLQIALCCIHGFGTKWTCCHIARKPRGREEGCWKQTGMLRPPDPLRGIEYCIETASVLASSSLVSSSPENREHPRRSHAIVVVPTRPKTEIRRK